ncbi:MAG: hypothetical protein LBF66_02305 [Holosporales bacterium]|jgi:hypothetical protein|nr:hypothetical protein [Holosporales bacterium]
MLFLGYDYIHLLSILAFSPLLGALFLLQAREERNIQNCTLWVNIFTLLIAIFAVWILDFPINGFDLVERVPWLAYGSVNYHLGVDNLSVVMVLLVSGIFPAITLASFNNPNGGRVRMMSLLSLEGCLLLAICAMDIIVLFIAFVGAYLCFLALIKTSRHTLKRRSLLQLAIGLVILFASLLRIADQTGSFSFEIVRYETANVPFERNIIFAAMLSLLSLAYPLGYIKQAFEKKEPDFSIMDFVCTTPMFIGRVYLIYRLFPLVQCPECRVCLYALFAILFISLYRFRELAVFSESNASQFSQFPTNEAASERFRTSALCLERIVVSFVLIDLLIDVPPKSIHLLINYTLAITCIYLALRCRFNPKRNMFALSALILLCTGFPCWSYISTLQKIIMQNAWFVGMAYLVGMFLFIGIMCNFMMKVGYVEDLLKLNVGPEQRDIRAYVIPVCMFVLSAGSLMTLNAYPYILPSPIDFFVNSNLTTENEKT